MKKCPYCAEEIQSNAIKCKHCGEWLQNPDVKSIIELPQKKEKDYLDTFADDQKQVTKYTKVALIFSLLWLAGIGSLIAIIYSNKAFKIIKHSQYPLSGKGVAIFSLILGILGVSFWGFAFIGAIISRI